MQIVLYTILGLFVFIFLIWLDLFLGRKKHYNTITKHEFPNRSSHFELFTSGPVLFDDLFSEIRKAKHHIHILFYICKNDEISKEFLMLLKEKAQKGVEVRLMLDWFGGRKVKKNVLKQLEEAGVEFAYSRAPTFPFLIYFSQVRNHRKIAVIDGKVGYLGGFNVGKEYIDLDKKLSPWRDYHLKVAGEGAADLQHQFLVDWKNGAQVNLLQNEIYFPRLEKGNIKHKFISSEGPMLEDIFLNILRKAKKSIVIGSPYFIPTKPIFKELCNALERGIMLTIIVPQISDHILVKEASYPYLRTLLKKGASIHAYKKGFYHAKVLLVDDQFCDLGTPNFDARSMKINDEMNCLIEDMEMVQKVKAVLRKDLLDSEKISLSHIKPGNVFVLLKEWLGRIFAPLL